MIKIYKVTFFLYLFISCVPLEDKSKIGCPQIAWFENLELNFNLKSAIADDYKIFLNGELVNQTCEKYLTPCVFSEEKSEEVLKTLIYLQTNVRPDKLDIKLVEEVGPEKVRIEELDIPLDWQPLDSYQNIEECGGPHSSKLVLFE